MPSTRYLEYPDLKRLDTIATQLFNMRHPEKEIKQIFWPRFEAEIFTQLWGSTCLAFDVVDGEPAIGGCAMTEDKYDGIACGLFEADGGEWKLTAKSNIYQYLCKELKDKNVVVLR
ncbi:MAG: hypothetical protein IJV29_06405 [Butyrivibrio sp.]|nr:hypothetical protein [Butyrivibrio sp.]